MSDKDTRQLSRELESLKETLTDNKPAQIPLLDDVVDQENLQQPPPLQRRRRRREDYGRPPLSGDLFASSQAPEASAPAHQDRSSPQADRMAENHLREQAARMAEKYLREQADRMAENYLRTEADRMVEDLVAEYSTEILTRLKARLTSQLYAILEDLDTDDDKP